MSILTPYAAAKIVNTELENLHIEKTLPPQMIYQYVTKGYIPSVLVEGKKRIKEEDLRTWFVTYVQKNFNTKIETQDPNQLQLF